MIHPFEAFRRLRRGGSWRERVDMASERFSVEAMVRGYHLYKDVWEAAVGEELRCEREPGNRQDPFAVAVVRSAVTVGLRCEREPGNRQDPFTVAVVRSAVTVSHILKKILSVCSMFLRRGGAIKCQVTASQRYSKDLPQGGLEIPCILTFEGHAKDLAKVNKLVKYTTAPSPAASKDTKDEPTAASKDEPANKKIRIEDPEVGHAGPSGTVCDIDNIVNGEKLSDLHINFAQRLLKQQSHGWMVCSQLLQSKKHVAIGKHIKDQLQVIHSCGDHWVLASTVGSKDGEVYVYDSVYHCLDKATTEVVINLFHSTNIKLIDSQKQEGGRDCGLFAISTATAIAHQADVDKQKFDQASMRSHLAKCFREEVLTIFPIVLHDQNV